MNCETYDDGSWSCWYDDGSEQHADAEGNSVFVAADGSSSSNWDWNRFFENASQAAVGIAGSASRTGYYIPQTQGQPQPRYSGGVNVTGGLRPGGAGGSLNISTNTLILIAAGVLLFMMGQRRGR